MVQDQMTTWKLNGQDTKTLLIADIFNFANYVIPLFHRGRPHDPEEKRCSCALHSPGSGLGGPQGSVLKGGQGG